MTEPPSRGERLVDILISIARSEYPHEWSHYCELARKLAQEVNERALEFSAEDCALYVVRAFRTVGLAI